MEFLIGTLFGCALTFLTLVVLAYHDVKKRTKLSVKNFEKALDDLELIGSVKYRFKKVDEITKTQMDLISQIDRPSASASHSRHKNDLIKQVKDLEDQKAAIFQTIVDDGFDPILGMVNGEGKVEDIKMSEAIRRHWETNTGSQKTLPPPPPKTDSISPKKDSKIIDFAKARKEKKNANTGPTKIH